MGKHEDVMNLLKSVPGVKEHLNSSQVQMGKQILIHRLEMALTQEKVLEICQKNGIDIDQNILSEIEIGSKSIQVNIYENVLNALHNK